MAIVPARLRPGLDRRIDRWRLTLRDPWGRWLGAVVKLRSGEGMSETRQFLREVRGIERGIRRGAPCEGQPGTSERVIEIPWTMSRIPGHAGRVLDIGTANAADVYLRCLRRLDVDELHLVDRVAADPRVGNVHVADVRRMPFEDDRFDATICISTLEHIGMDNAIYFSNDEATADQRGDLAAVKEMCRVTRPGGRVLVTVPAGRAEDYGWFRQYSAERWAAVVSESGAEAVETAFYVHDPQLGWRRTDERGIEGADYQVGAPFAGALLCASLAPGEAS